MLELFDGLEIVDVPDFLIAFEVPRSQEVVAGQGSAVRKIVKFVGQGE